MFCGCDFIHVAGLDDRLLRRRQRIYNSLFYCYIRKSRQMLCRGLVLDCVFKYPFAHRAGGGNFVRACRGACGGLGVKQGVLCVRKAVHGFFQNSADPRGNTRFARLDKPENCAYNSNRARAVSHNVFATDRGGVRHRPRAFGNGGGLPLAQKGEAFQNLSASRFAEYSFADGTERFARH